MVLYGAYCCSHVCEACQLTASPWLPDTHLAQVCRHWTIARLIAAWWRKEGSDVLCCLEIVPGYGGQSIIPLFDLRQQQVLAATLCCWHAYDQRPSGAAAGSLQSPGGCAFRQLPALLLSLCALFDKGQFGTVIIIYHAFCAFEVLRRFTYICSVDSLHCKLCSADTGEMERCCQNCRRQPLLLNHVALAEQEMHPKVSRFASPARLWQSSAHT